MSRIRSRCKMRPPDPILPAETSESYGAELFALRTARGLAQADLARKANLSRSYLSEVENDRRPPPSLDVCRRLVDALDLAPAECSRLWAFAFHACSPEQSLPTASLAALIGDIGRLLPRLTPERIEKVRRHLKEVAA